MDIIDIHTHRLANATGSDNAIISYSMLDESPLQGAKMISLSIHPWYLTNDNADFQIKRMEALIESDKRVVAIGECGIDKICGVSVELQKSVFYEAAKIAQAHSLPLIIHSVRSSNEIIEARQKLGKEGIWIIHGFRGNRQVAASLLKHDISLSFGERYNPEALREVPFDKLFLETDDSLCSINDIAQRVSCDYGVDIEELERRTNGNVCRCFPLA